MCFVQDVLLLYIFRLRSWLIRFFFFFFSKLLMIYNTSAEKGGCIFRCGICHGFESPWCFHWLLGETNHMVWINKCRHAHVLKLQLSHDQRDQSPALFCVSITIVIRVNGVMIKTWRAARWGMCPIRLLWTGTVWCLMFHMYGHDRRPFAFEGVCNPFDEHLFLSMTFCQSSTTETMRSLPSLGQFLGRLCWIPFITADGERYYIHNHDVLFLIHSPLMVIEVDCVCVCHVHCAQIPAEGWYSSVCGECTPTIPAAQ